MSARRYSHLRALEIAAAQRKAREAFATPPAPRAKERKPPEPFFARLLRKVFPQM